MTQPAITSLDGLGDEQCLRPTEVAAIMRMSPSWVHDELRRGALPHIRRNRTAIIVAGDLRAYIAANKVPRAIPTIQQIRAHARAKKAVA